MYVYICVYMYICIPLPPTPTHHLIHTVEYDPFSKSPLASHNYLQGLLWGKFGHVTTVQNAETKPSYSTRGHPGEQNKNP